MKKILFITLFLGMMNYPLMAKKVAFLVGVGNVSPLLNTNKDIETIKSLLAKGYEIIELQDDNASYTKLRSTFEELYKLDEDDTLFFYYTGHGSRFYHGSREKDNLDEFLVLSSMKIEGNEISGGVMMDDELNYHFSHIKAKKILFFDCCHSETMKKGIGSTVKSWYPKGKSGEILYRKFDIDPSYDRAINENFINLSAARDDEESEDSDNGGIFTLTLKKVLKDKGDIPFSELMNEIKNNLLYVARKNHTSGDFMPNMDSNRMNPKSFRTKEIFAVVSKPTPLTSKESLEHYLNSKKGGISLKIESKQEEYPLGDSITFYTHLEQQRGYLYLLEVKKEKYSIVAKKKVENCKSNGAKKECLFSNLASMLPLGRTNVYLIYSKNPLDISKNHTKGFSESLKSQLKHQNFEVGYENFKTVE